MQEYEQNCSPEGFYYGYLTVMDFALYETMNYFSRLFPNKVDRFPKLIKLQQRVAEIPEVSSYEESERAVVEFCPLKYFKRFKEEKLRMRDRNSC